MLVKTAFPINWGHKEEVVEGAAAANDVDIRVAAKLEVSGYKGGCVHIWIFVPIRFFGPDLSSLILALCRYRVWSNTTYYIAAEDMQRWLNMYLGHWNNQCSLLNVTDLIFHKLFTSIWHQVISWRENVSLRWSCWNYRNGHVFAEWSFFPIFDEYAHWPAETAQAWQQPNFWPVVKIVIEL